MFWNGHESSHILRLACILRQLTLYGCNWLYSIYSRTCSRMDMNHHTYHAICLYIVATNSMYGCIWLCPRFRTWSWKRHELSPISQDSFLRVYEAILTNYGGNSYRYYISSLQNQGSFAGMHVILHMIGHLQKQTFAEVCTYHCIWALQMSPTNKGLFRRHTHTCPY